MVKMFGHHLAVAHSTPLLTFEVVPKRFHHPIYIARLLVTPAPLTLASIPLPRGTAPRRATSPCVSSSSPPPGLLSSR
jgi:hypothetical protein